MHLSTKLFVAAVLVSTTLQAQKAADTPAQKHTPARIQDLGIPAALQADAKRAQTDGRRIFVWRATNDALKTEASPFGQVIGLDVHYARLFLDDDAPFDLYFYTAAIAKDGTRGTTYGTRTDGPKTADKSGTAGIMFISPKDKLSGEGFGYAFAIERSKVDGAKLAKASDAISNEIKFPIKFSEK
jgi:hypothetical protein